MQLEQCVRDHGRPMRISGNQPLPLNGRLPLWWVLSGRAEVFSVPVLDAASEQLGCRTSLLRVEAGELILGTGPLAGSQPFVLLASGLGGTRLLELDRAQLAAVAASPDGAAELERALAQWAGGLADAIAPSQAVRDYHLLEPGAGLRAAAGGVFRPAKGVLWIKLSQGEARWCGQPAAPLRPDDGWFPLNGRTWIEIASESAIVRVAKPGQLAAEHPQLEPLDAFARFVLRRVESADAQRREQERSRLLERSGADRRSFSSALARFGAVLDPALGRLPAHEAQDNLMLAALRLIGDHLGVEIKIPENGPANLSGLVRASRLRRRQVVLRGRWWRDDNGPLLGGIGQGADKKPVVLLPVSPRRYVMVDPATGRRRKVYWWLARKLDPVAFMFYRPFPARPLGPADLLRTVLGLSPRDLAMVLGVGLVGGLFGTFMPIMTGYVYDTLIPSADRKQLLQVAVGLALAAVSMAAFELTRRVATLRLSGKTNVALQSAVMDRVLSLPVPFFRGFTAGDLAERARGIDRIREALSGNTLNTVLGGLFSVYNLGLLLWYDLRLGLVAAGLTALAVLVTAGIGWVKVRHERAMAGLEGRLSGIVLQLIQGVPKFRVAGLERRAFVYWSREYTRLRQITHKVYTLANVFQVFRETYLVLTLMAIFAALLQLDDQPLSTGQFLAFQSAFGVLLVATLSVAMAVIETMRVLPIYERARPILETRPEVDEARADPGVLRGEIEVSHVAFRYAPDTPLVLRDVSVQIRPGEMVALVGGSGCGKSTLFRLMLGFETPESGNIYFDGNDLDGIDLRAVRRQMGVVLQNSSLMPGSLFDNIIGAAHQLTVDDAWEAARMAGLAADIERMPMGMHTVVGQGGGTLSGGQRQRLLIARALVHRPRMLFFDEATSALDNKTQKVVSESLERLNATRVVIAHRLSTIIHADRIYVLDQGLVAQSGSYEELMAQGGMFAELARRQIA